MTDDELMQMTVLGCSRKDLYINKPQLSKNQEDVLKNMKYRRNLGEPLQYILGRWSFLSVLLNVDKRALIPRFETEILVNEAIKRLNKNKKQCHVLNIGVGSGNIEIAIAKAYSNIKIVGVDISKEALTLAYENIRQFHLNNRIALIEADAENFLKEIGHKEPISKSVGTKSIFNTYDLVISNPPYIPTKQLGHLSRDVQWEPKVALDGGEDGLDFYRFIIPLSIDIISSSGLLMFECGDGQYEYIKNLINQTNAFETPESIKDYVGIDRVVIARRK